MKESIHSVLHGGLGNQLFQYFYARISSDPIDRKALHLTTSFLGDYSSPRAVELLPLISKHQQPDSIVSDPGILIRLRLPKLIRKVTGQEYRLQIPGFGMILDGYFQEFDQYCNISRTRLSSELALWRSMLAVILRLDLPAAGRLIHIRLGDFFSDRVAARNFATQQLLTIGEPADLVTDQEDVLLEALDDLKVIHPVQLVTSKEMSAWELMAFMCRYETISTNGSTLAFWATVMRRARLMSTNPDHMKIWQLTMAADEFKNSQTTT